MRRSSSRVPTTAVKRGRHRARSTRPRGRCFQCRSSSTRSRSPVERCSTSSTSRTTSTPPERAPTFPHGSRHPVNRRRADVVRTGSDRQPLALPVLQRPRRSRPNALRDSRGNLGDRPGRHRVRRLGQQNPRPRAAGNLLRHVTRRWADVVAAKARGDHPDRDRRTRAGNRPPRHPRRDL